MKRIVAIFLCVTLGLSSFPVYVYAKTDFKEHDTEYLVDETREQADSSQGNLQTSEEKTFENVEYGYVLTVTPVDTEIELKSGTAVRYSLLPIDSDKTMLGMKGVYGNIIVITIQTMADDDIQASDLGSTLFVRLDNGEVVSVVAGTDSVIHPILPGMFREKSDPDALYRFGNTGWTFGEYVLCDDPAATFPLVLVEADGLYDVVNTETGRYFDYDLADFRFGANNEYYSANGLLIGYTDGPAHLRETIYISDTGELLFGEEFQNILLNEKLYFSVQDSTGKYGIYAYDGEERIPCKYDAVYDYSGTTAVVKENGYWYVVGEKGGEIVPLCDTETYSGISHFSNGVAVGHRLIYGYSGYTGDEGYYYETDDLIFDDGHILDLAKLFGGKYASVHYDDDPSIPSLIDPSAICVEVESYVEGSDGGYPTQEDYVLNFRGIIDQSGAVICSFGEEFDFGFNSYFDQANSFCSGENSFVEIEKVRESEEDEQYLATKTGSIITIPKDATYQYIKDKYLLIQDPDVVNGDQSYIIDENKNVIWSSSEEVSGGNNYNILSSHILLRGADATGVLYLNDLSFSGFIWETYFTNDVSPSKGSVTQDLLVLKSLSGAYSVLDDSGEIVSGLPYQPHILTEGYILANVEDAIRLNNGYKTYYAYELQYFDRKGNPIWPEDTYFSESVINNISGITDHLYGTVVLTDSGFGYMALNGETIISPDNKELSILQPGQLILTDTGAETAELIDAASGSIIAEVQKSNYGEISAESNNGAVHFRNAIENYIVYPKGTGDSGSEVDGSVVIISAPESIYLDGTGTIYAEYISSDGGLDAAQVTWETSDPAVLEIISTNVAGNRLSAVVKGNGVGASDMTVRLSNGRAASVSIKILPKSSTAFSHTELTPVCGNQHVLPNISLTNKFQISYDRDIELNQGYLLIYEYETDRLVEAISSSQAKFSGLREIEFNTQNPLSPNTKYYVLVDDGLVRDAQNLSEISQGISQKEDWCFTTASLDVYSRMITEEELFTTYPQFLTEDQFLKSVNNFYSNLVTDIDEYDRNLASLFYVAENIQGGDPATVFISAILMFIESVNLPEEKQEDMAKAILLQATQSQNYMDNLSESIWVEHGADIAKIVREVTPENAKVDISKCIQAIYENLGDKMPKYFPAYDQEFMVRIIKDTDFDNVFVQKIKEIFGKEVDTLSVFEFSMIGLKIFTEYMSTQQIAVDLISTFQEELEKAGLADDTSVTLERIKKQITGYSSIMEGLIDFIPEIADMINVLVGAIETPSIFSVVNLGCKGVSFIYKQAAGSTEEILDVYAGAIYAAKLRYIIEFERKQFQNFTITTEDIQTFEIMYQLYISALHQVGKALLKVDLSDQSRAQLNAYLKDLENYTYNSYRDKCLDYAQDYIVCIGANLEYEIRDGKLYITGFPESTSVQKRTKAVLTAEEKTLYLTSDAGKSSWLVIPEEIDGYPVAGIADYAFAGNRDLRTVYVAADLEFVGEKAFYGCTSLESISFSNGTQSIARDAFANNPNLKIASLSTSDCMIEDTAFANCPSLQYIITNSMKVRFSDTAAQNSPQVTIVGLKDSGAAQYAYSAGLDFVTADPSIQTVQVAKLPNKTQYTVGEPLIMDGMVLDLELSDGTHQKVTDGWTTLGETDHVGTAKIVILYGAQSTEIEVTVVNDEDTNIDQGNQSSGGSGESVFPISTNATENGTITVTPVRASRGSIITVIAEADEGFILGSLRVFDQKGDEISLNKEGDKFTFIMPASKVSVEGKFVEREMNPFLDVEERDYFYNAVLWAMKNGVTSGTTDTTFSPDITCTRAQTVTFLWRAAGSPHPQNTVNPFGDVDEDSYYYEAVLWAVENGITAGTSAIEFSPDANCTRGQVITFLYRHHGMQATEEVYFSDVQEDSYYYDAVQWAVQNGITAGTSMSTFSPNAECTRAQIVTFLYQDFKE